MIYQPPLLFDFTDFAETMPAGYLPCGHSKYDNDHYDECLKRTCPKCGVRERNGFQLQSMHGHVDWSGPGEPCHLQRWHWDRIASCLGCSSWTFGVWPCRNAACAFSDPDAIADPALWMPHPTVETWWHPYPWHEQEDAA